VGYVGQFDNLVREADRGHAIRFTRSVVVFTDGLAVCPVAVPGATPALHRSLIGGLLRRGTPPDSEDLRRLAEAMTAGTTAAEFAQAWPGGVAVPFAVVARVVLSRPRQVSELAVYENVAGLAEQVRTVYLGDLAADRVRDMLGPLLGGRLEIARRSMSG
jgi:hypothetical protein